MYLNGDQRLCFVAWSKKSFLGSRMRRCSIRPEDVREFLDPLFFDFVELTFETAHYDSTGGLRLPVCLRVFEGGKVLCFPKVGYEFLEVLSMNCVLLSVMIALGMPNRERMLRL